MSELLFGNRQSEFVHATVSGRAYPKQADSIDRNWLTVSLEIAARPFSGTYPALWRAESFTPFREELESLYETLGGQASFMPDWEGSLVLTLVGDGRGHVSLSGNACPDAGAGPWLKFSLPDIDQTYLPHLIAQLRDLEDEYPG